MNSETSHAAFEQTVSGTVLTDVEYGEGHSSKFRRWIAFVVLGVLWFGLLNHLRLEWSVNDQYSYGFAVPLLALYLFAQRWKSAPMPDKPPCPGLLLGIVAVASLLLLPLHLIEEANPEWRFVSWSMALIVVTISMALLLYRAGLPWAKHFLFPVCFILTAVPWPSTFEGGITEMLMRFDASVAVEFLQWLGIPAIQHGNIINVAGGVVGVDEACSGIRSLQNTVMISLFLGELYRFGFLRRAMLVCCAAAVAFLCNLGRTFFLAWLSAGQGTHVMEKWHDSAGFAVLAISLAALLGITFILRRGCRRVEDFTDSRNAPIFFNAWPSRFLAGVGVWLFVVIASTEIWYRVHESRALHAPGWSVRWPVDAPGFRDETIPATTRALLKYTEGRHASWSREDGVRWSAFFFRWAPGRTARIAARWHRPDVCLSAIGHQLQTDEGIRMFTASGVAIPFHGYTFDESGRPLHVWQCIWDDETSTANGLAAADKTSQISNRFKAVLHGRRNLGQQVFEVAFWVGEKPVDAQLAFQDLLESMIER